MFLLSESTVVVVTLRVWFHGPAGEDVTRCIITNILGHLAKLEEISGGREGGRGGGREGGGRREEEEGRREKGRRKKGGERREEEGSREKGRGREKGRRKERTKDGMP